jgi:hypothetical protein
LWFSPGYVLLIVIPDLKNKNTADPLEPKVDANTISRIKTAVEKRTGSQVQVSVKNPVFQKVQVDFKVRFKAGYEFNAYSKETNQALVQFLSPWASDSTRELSFGGKIYRSVLLDFVEDLYYVDFVTEFKMFSYIGTNSFEDIGEAQPSTPDAILVSERAHLITQV